MSIEETVAKHESDIVTLYKKLDSTDGFGDKIITKMDDILKELHLIKGRDDAGAIKTLGDRVTIVERAMWALGGAVSIMGLDKITCFFK